MPEHRLEIEALGAADVLLLGRNQAGQVDAEAHLQRRVPAQVRHDQRLVGVALDLEFDADVVGAHVADVEQRRQLARDHQVGDARDQLRLVDRVGNRGDRDHLAGAPDLALLPRAAQADRAAAGAVDLLQLVGRVEDLAAGGEVRALDVLAQLQRRQFGVVDQPQQRRAHLAEMMRRDVGGHADGDAHRAVDQQRRDARRQHDGLGARAVVVRAERHRVLIEFREQFVADARQPAFGVAHGRGAVAVERAEVARAVDQRIAQRERLRHAHQRLVQRAVAVRVVVAHHVADDLGALAVLGVGGEVLLPHRVEDAALHGLQAVAHVGQGARRDDREGVVEVARLRGFVQRRRRSRRDRSEAGACRRRRARRAGRTGSVQRTFTVSLSAFGIGHRPVGLRQSAVGLRYNTSAGCSLRATGYTKANTWRSICRRPKADQRSRRRRPRIYSASGGVTRAIQAA